MIISDNGVFKIDGEQKDIVFDLNLIFEYFIEKNPETLAGVLAAWNDKLITALSAGDINSSTLDNATQFSKSFISRDWSKHYKFIRKVEKEGDTDD